MAGVSASTNQAEVKAAAVPATARTIQVVTGLQRAGACSSCAALDRNDGRVNTKTASSTPAHTSESACPCGAAGVWKACASDGTAIVAAASIVSVDTSLARDESNRCVPFFRPPTVNAIPSTSTLFARIDPTSAA